MEKDAAGNVQYVNQISLNFSSLQQFTFPGGEVLWIPRENLCVKFCETSPLRHPVWFDGSEVKARCPVAKIGSTFAGNGSSAIAVNRSLEIFENESSAIAENIWFALSGGFNNAIMEPARNSLAPEWTLNAESVLKNWARTVMLEGGGKSEQQVCTLLEAQYEPMAFIHRRDRQRNLYYRFEALPLGAKRCCCK